MAYDMHVGSRFGLCCSRDIVKGNVVTVVWCPVSTWDIVTFHVSIWKFNYHRLVIRDTRDKESALVGSANLCKLGVHIPRRTAISMAETYHSVSFLPRFHLSWSLLNGDPADA